MDPDLHCAVDGHFRFRGRRAALTSICVHLSMSEEGPNLIEEDGCSSVLLDVEEVLFRFRSVGYWKALEPPVFATVSLIRINRHCSIVKVVEFLV